MTQLTVVLGTKNPHKVREIRAIWRLAGKKPAISFIPLYKFSDIPNVKENGRTYLANATKKAIAWARYTGLPTLAEDSGIEVKALNWQPGIYSARYASIPLRRDGKGRILSDPFGNRKNAPYKNNNQKLLAKLKGLPIAKRTARYRCAAVIAAPNGKIIARAQGICWGRIALKPVGKNGFGYDPIFTPTPNPLVWGLIPKLLTSKFKPLTALTFGQLPAYLKHRISHRSITLRKIFKKISQFLDMP